MNNFIDGDKTINDIIDSDETTNELFAEYHLGRSALRMCKRETKYCGWHREMPKFYQWR